MKYGRTKKCLRCKKKKGIRAFCLSGAGYRHSYCRACASIAYRKYATENSAKLLAYAAVYTKRNYALIEKLKAVPCTDCKGSFPAVVMDFDHLPGCKKLYKVADMARAKYSEKAILTEAAKCEVVCANCHRIRTSTRAAALKASRNTNG